jgi:hypothetical protein
LKCKFERNGPAAHHVIAIAATPEGSLASTNVTTGVPAVSDQSRASQQFSDQKYFANSWPVFLRISLSINEGRIHRYTKRGRTQFMSTITTKDGTQIYYKDWGAGPVVTFSHGWTLTGDAWESQMLFLAYRINNTR